MQSVQWLCRETFDCKNGSSSSNGFAQIWVNTDKTNDGFSPVVLARVRDVLIREREDQLACPIKAEFIAYEGRSHTRFPKLIPLFRNPVTNRPVADPTYAKAWTKLLQSFQGHYNESGNVELVVLQRPKRDKVATTHLGNPYCPLEIRAHHTPHSCRSTFITRRSQLMDLDDLALLVGHADGKVSAHYNYVEDEELGAKLLNADTSFQAASEAEARITSGPALIKARDKNAALRRSFDSDREETIQTYSVITLKPCLADDLTTSGLDLLRASPVSQIVFRDTHICPVGEECPSEAMAVTGGRRRCGMCPLACKSVDHLPAILAKQRQLLERIQTSIPTLHRLRKGKEDPATLDELHEAITDDLRELCGWQMSEELLETMRVASDRLQDAYHVAEPELVRKHIQRVIRPSPKSEFVLRRILEADAYPVMSTPHLQAQAEKLKRQLLAGVVDPSTLLREAEGDDDIAALASLIRTVMLAKECTLETLAAELQVSPALIGWGSSVLLASDSAA